MSYSCEIGIGSSIHLKISKHFKPNKELLIHPNEQKIILELTDKI